MVALAMALEWAVVLLETRSLLSAVGAGTPGLALTLLQRSVTGKPLLAQTLLFGGVTGEPAYPCGTAPLRHLRERN